MKEGDKVISWVYGIGVVKSSYDDKIFRVEFDSGSQDIHPCGRYLLSELNPTWYPIEEFKQRWPADYARMTQPDIKPGTPIFVWNDCDTEYSVFRIRRFCGFTLGGLVRAYDEMPSNAFTWANWSLTDPLEEV
jgi:hypothetical protein